MALGLLQGHRAAATTLEWARPLGEMANLRVGSHIDPLNCLALCPCPVMYGTVAIPALSITTTVNSVHPPVWRAGPGHIIKKAQDQWVPASDGSGDSVTLSVVSVMS